MTLFEWFKSCSIEDMAEWLVEFQYQCEKNMLDKFKDAGVEFTQFCVSKEIGIANMIKAIDEEITSHDIHEIT